jgi:vacuolar-type H+-ATPase subunit I/STV1
MDDWQSWATALFGFLLSTLGFSHRSEKQQTRESLKALEQKYFKLSERVVKVESEAMSESEVREVLKEVFAPFMRSLENVSSNVTEIKVAIARLEQKAEDRRKNDS